MTKLPLHFHYWTDTKGINGNLKSKKDFIVKENTLSKFLKKFQRTKKGMEKVQGKYFLCKLKKEGKTTKEAIDFISKKLNIYRDQIGYAGLKDKNAITEQYLTIPKDKFQIINEGDLSLEKIKQTNKKIHIGDLESNSFEITLHDCKDKGNLEETIEELKEKGMPNYFGMQRFGLNKDNHIKGKKILKNKIKPNESKDSIKFYIHAYQSYIFNECLNKYIENNNKPKFSKISLVGSKSKIENDIVQEILKKENVTKEDFELDQYRNINCIGSQRPMFVKVEDVAYNIGDLVSLKFTLPKGSYATTLLREVEKKV